MATKTLNRRKTRSQASKPRKRRTTSAPLSAMAAVERRINRRAYAPSLPFSVCRDVLLPMVDQDVKLDLRSLDWGDREIALADGALRAGFQVSFGVHPSWIACAAAIVSQTLNTRVSMGYDPEAQRIVVWNATDPDDEIDEPTCHCCASCRGSCGNR